MPEGTHAVRSFHALSLRRDLAALRRVQPSFGVSAIPEELELHRGFDRALLEAMRILDERMRAASVGVPFGKLYGAWEGGLPAHEAPDDYLNGKVLPLQVCALNLRGSLSRGLEVQDEKVLALCSGLMEKGVLLAISSEPRVAPGAVWPDWSGYKLVGERVDDACSVAAAILAEVGV